MQLEFTIKVLKRTAASKLPKNHHTRGNNTIWCSQRSWLNFAYKSFCFGSNAVNARGVLSLSLHKGGVKIVLVASTAFANFLVGFARETYKMAVWSPKSLESRLLRRLYLMNNTQERVSWRKSVWISFPLSVQNREEGEEVILGYITFGRRVDTRNE